MIMTAIQPSTTSTIEPKMMGTPQSKVMGIVEPKILTELQQKIKQCKVLMIQNIERSLQHKMFYMFLKNSRKESDVQSYTFNTKDELIIINFFEHQKAMSFYNQYNFNAKILMRPFNIYFNLSLSEKQLKKYHLQGVTEENLRALFQIVRKKGICKLYTKYTKEHRGNLKSTAVLSFIRDQDISIKEFDEIAEKLKEINIKISKYNPEKQKNQKICLNITNLLQDTPFNIKEEQNTLRQIAENRAKKLLQKYTGKTNYNNLLIQIKKKEIVVKNTDQKGQKLLSRAIVDFQDYEEAFSIYQKLRIGILNQGEVKANLYFYNQEYNSYISLITQGLVKKQEQTEKQFEEQLLNAFRLVNKNVVQVNVYRNKTSKIYFGRLYLASQEEGKNFLVDYNKFNSSLYEYYLDKLINFNLSIDVKTQNKMKHAQENAAQNAKRIKQGQQIQQNAKKVVNSIPLSYNPVVGMGMQPIMPPHFSQSPMGQGPIMLPPTMGMMPQFGNRGIMMPPKNIPPYLQPAINPNLTPLRSYSIPPLQKQSILEMDEQRAKGYLTGMLGGILRDMGVSPDGERNIQISSQLLKGKSSKEVLDLLDTAEELKRQALEVKTKLSKQQRMSD